VRLRQRLRDLERIERMARGLLEPAERQLRAREADMRVLLVGREAVGGARIPT
jgi:hypothetical protein